MSSVQIVILPNEDMHRIAKLEIVDRLSGASDVSHSEVGILFILSLYVVNLQALHGLSAGMSACARSFLNIHTHMIDCKLMTMLLYRYTVTHFRGNLRGAQS
jgi:hypothetical protein